MRAWLIGAGAGAAASALILVPLLLDKKKRLEAQGKRLQEQLEAGEGSALAERAAGIEDRLKVFAERYTEPRAKAAADAHLAEHYGLTPERIQSIERLSGAVRSLL